MTVFFNSTIAKEYGTNAAILLQSIYGWIRFNKRNGTNYHDGRYWTYSSRKAFADTFTFISERTIWATLKKLCEDGLLLTGNYNASSYDRTTWYALSDKGEALMQKAEMDCEDSAQSKEQESRNGTAQVAQSNAQEHTDNTIMENIVEDNVVHIDNNPPTVPPQGGGKSKTRLTQKQLAMFEQFYQAYPKHKARGDAEKAWKTIDPDEDLLETILEAVNRQRMSEDWRKEGGRYVPYPASWLRDAGWLDEEDVNVTPIPSQPTTLTLGESATQNASAARREAMIKQLEAARDKTYNEMIGKLREG